MILSSAVVFGFGAGLLRAWAAGRRFTAPRLRHVGLVWLAFLPQWFIFLQPDRSAGLPADWASLALCASQALLLVFAWCNRRMAGLRMMGLGLLLNLLVILLNGGWMPISPSTVQAIYPQAEPGSWQVGQRLGTGKDVVLHPEDTRLVLLSDRYIVPAWTGCPLAFSLGDVLLAVGVIWLLWNMGGFSHRSDDAISQSKYGAKQLQERTMPGVQPAALSSGDQPAFPAAAVVEPG